MVVVVSCPKIHPDLLAIHLRLVHIRISERTKAFFLHPPWLEYHSDPSPPDSINMVEITCLGHLPIHVSAKS